MLHRTRTFSSACLLLAACVALLLPGCVKYKQTLTIQPDGSGKMDFVIGMSLGQLATLGPGADPFEAFSIANLAENPQGFVAFTEPRATDRDGFRVLTVTGYFEDVDELGFSGGIVGPGDDGFDAVAYTLEDGSLTVRRPLSGQAAAAFGGQEMDLNDEDLRRVMAPAVAGLELTERYVLPGTVRSAGPLTTAGNAAEVSVQGSAVLDRYPELMERYAGLDAVRIDFEGRAWPAGGEAAWRQELDDAKAAWARLARGG